MAKINIKIDRAQPTFTIVSNTVLKDPNLSWQAKGLYSYLVSNQSDYQIYKTEIQNHSKAGRKATCSAWKELVNLGWITSKRETDSAGKFKGWTHVVYCDLGRERPSPASDLTELHERRNRQKAKSEKVHLINNNNNKYQIQREREQQRPNSIKRPSLNKTQKQTAPAAKNLFDEYMSAYPFYPNLKNKARFIRDAFERLTNDQKRHAIDAAKQYALTLQSGERIISAESFILSKAYIRYYEDGKTTHSENSAEIRAAAASIQELSNQEPALMMFLSFFGGKKDISNVRKHWRALKKDSINALLQIMPKRHAIAKQNESFKKLLSDPAKFLQDEAWLMAM